MSEPSKQTIYTNGYDESVLKSHRWRTLENSAKYLLPHLNKSMSVLDIGSGAGTITLDFVPLVARVTGLEISKEAMDLTLQEAARQGVDIDTAIGDVHALPFHDNAFDVVHAHQVLQHVANPIVALREMRRVTKQGGLVAACDTDFGVASWFPEDALLEEWSQMFQTVARSNGAEPNAGRRLLYWAMEAGFTDVEPGASTWCFATTESREYWGGMWGTRILTSSINDQAKARGYTHKKLEAMSAAWQRWVESPYGWFMMPHGTILARK
ncbi:hypothetical protein MVES1_004011 [Malassezia vespertilionis]|uniref:Methyltransferase type 11 domain-containing protein n=1 Tax=Malassezia vespertilionis TaxID=2020962 RepID=A0A2N1J7I1_9BASI|nr:uncharacterized protein MVES1_004011 [Malassezia vespertilionis]PKI82515.1 hypothetical protein MVES_003560 [Malassezia vespertilionis]WFD08634.1 hypothetical protein MVES1_004011 [Malassezia vespertilionis]